MKYFLLLILLCGAPVAARAQGTAFTYQGRLSDGANFADGFYDLRFTLFDASSGGSALAGPITNSPTGVTNGLFTATLNFGAGVFDGGDRWLEIGVRTYEGSGFTTLSPRQRLTPTPYAITASHLTGTASAATNFTGPLAGDVIGTQGATVVWSVGGQSAANVASGASAANAATSANTANAIVKRDASGSFSAGAITVGSVSGDGSGLTSLNASQLTSGTVNDARLSSNAALRNGNNVFTGSNTFNGVVTATHTNNQFGGTFIGTLAGSGAGLTNLMASQLVGTISPNNIGAGSITSTKLAAGAVTTAALADGAVTAAKVFSVTNWLVLTITNPAPTSSDLFGMGLAAVGSDRFMIGAPNAGAAYLFNINGELLTTITNPTAGSGFFGSKVAVMGNDRVLVGAIGVFPGGAAHLFSLNGTLLTTITNPTPAFNDQFGSALAAVGSSGVLIGALNDSTSATNAGIAYLFSTNGTLVTTFTEPTPAAEHQFGISVAAMGSDRVLIGTRHDNLGPGAAYLFSTNGTLLTTFTNPTPFADDNFGSAVTAVANNRVLIGAFSADRGGLTNAGAAYLFSTNGTLLTTFTNPTPASSDFFGASVEDAGNDHVLIGATFDDAGGFNAGAAYLFSSDGTLLATFINPTPAVNDNFGSAVAAVGSNRMLIGAFSDDAGADGAGVAHLFTFESFTPGLVAAGVRLGGVTSDSIAAGAVSAHQLAEGAVGSGQLAAGAVTTSALADGAVTTTALADSAVTADKIDTVSDWFPLTIPNPTPAPVEGFAWSVAALGNGRLIIGASADDAGNDAGAAYLFSTKGVLLTTITNPTPEQFDAFGNSVAAVGSAMVLVGAPQDNTGAQDAGAAYLFTTNGVLITTFLNPTPVTGENFGESVAAVGANHVLIGSPDDRPGALHFGAAYLFGANGVLVNTFTNPTPASLDSFGFSVAGMGNNRVLIGATRDDAGATNAGVVHLFHTNGTLLTTFTNPTPEVGEEFGYAVAALGNDRVIIGALGDSTGGSFSGAAYLFSTNGALLTTFTNPTSADFDNFGISVAAVGGDRVLIGAGFDSTGATNAGAAYLFSTNGVLLTTLTNPAPEANDQFGRAVAVVGTNRVLIGANYDNVLTPDAGAAYLFTLESFSPGVIADGVRGNAITTEDLADGAVTAMKLDPTIGVWTRSGNDVFRSAGNVGIGTTAPRVSTAHRQGN
jgi:hypothetical protein